MAYWNPFGWSEETRRSIQSVVRPVMQVASMAASMGAFSGGGGGQGGNTGTGTEGGAMSPTTGTGTMHEALKGEPGLREWNTDMALDAPEILYKDDVASGSLAMPDGSQLPPSQQSTGFTPPTEMNQALGASPQQQQQIADGFGLGTPDLGTSSNQFWNDSRWIPENAQQFQDVAQVEGLVVEPWQPTDGNKILSGEMSMGEINAKQGAMVKEGDYVTPETGVKPKPNQAPQQPTETPNTPEVKPPQTKVKPPGDGKGPGGQEKGYWDDKPFNLKNALEFLQTPEGLKWLNSDKGLAGIGRRLSAASDAGVAMTLTNEELKKMGERVRKKQEEKRRKKKNNR